MEEQSNEFALHQACMNGDIKKVQDLLEGNSALVNMKDEDGRHPIHWAISSQHAGIVELLLLYMKKMDLDSLLDDSDWSPMHVASAVGDYEIFVMLLNHDIKPLLDESTSQGTTPLHLACSKKHQKIVSSLIERGASVRTKDKYQRMALHRACASGCIAVVKLLCDARHPVNSRDVNGWPPLFHALSEGHADVAVLLVQEYGAEWEEVKSNSGETALDVAVDKNVREYFLKHVV
ncbi:Nas6p Ecym_2082 [Eremothecium cymbalariae DBVPG|uniref:Uncharacterized protein n=1 Tax=Eremothecium cymbalariae (strain CBS 270.75 / DBVPG 7215 / KCTC 17166 / NRRL Y-17582) TaxID=931890 RepID=G8JPI8_ERECY|nr:Hypothetical protein Ecym_2082 [Eremothecium cymbalariae DBVPG\